MASNPDVSDITDALISVFQGAYMRGHPYAAFDNGWLYGSLAPTSLARPTVSYVGGAPTMLVPKRDASVLLSWASQYVGRNLDPRLARALAHPYVNAYSMLAPDHIPVPLL